MESRKIELSFLRSKRLNPASGPRNAAHSFSFHLRFVEGHSRAQIPAVCLLLFAFRLPPPTFRLWLCAAFRFPPSRFPLSRFPQNQTISPFYGTSSPTGAAALLPLK